MGGWGGLYVCMVCVCGVWIVCLLGAHVCACECVVHVPHHPSGTCIKHTGKTTNPISFRQFHSIVKSNKDTGIGLLMLSKSYKVTEQIIFSLD